MRPIVALVLLHLTMFVPQFVMTGGGHDVLPFTPREHPYGAWGVNARSALEYVKALTVRRVNLDVFRVSIEVLALAFLVAMLRGKWWAAWAGGLAYVTGLVLLVYQHTSGALYRAEPALWEDVTLLPSLLGYVSATFGRWAPPVIVLGALLVSAVGAWCTGWVFILIAERPRSRQVLGGLLLVGLVSLAWFGVERDDPVFQLPTKVLARNVRESLRRRERLLTLRASGADPRYAFAQRARLSKTPPVSLLMIEAYGQRLVSDPQLRPVFERLASRVKDRLTASGYSVRTAFSEAPVYGGKSWLSVATVQTGVRVESPSLYDEMAPRAPRLSTFTAFFKAQGYRTVALLPGNYRDDLPRSDPYARDVMIEFKDLDYHGQFIGYVGVLDQYTLNFFRTRIRPAETGPLMTFYLSISTHHPWPAMPFEGGPAWPPLAGWAELPEGMGKKYVASVEYEWRCLLELLEAERSPDAVFFIVGDHQPLLERTMDDVRELTAQQSSNTPVHVISRNPAMVERFAKYGFIPGLVAEPGTGGLKHEGLSSLFIHEFVGEYGGAAEQRFTRYEPAGIGLGGLVPGVGADGAFSRDGGVRSAP
jgi:hypothetical protein